MIRQILIHIRNVIDKILWKTAKNRFYDNTATNCSGTVTLWPTVTNTIVDCIVSSNLTDGIWFCGSADGNQT